MIHTWEDDHGQMFAMGVGKVLKAPKTGKTKRGLAYCQISAEVDRFPTGQTSPDGKSIFNNTIMTFSAFGSLAGYCANLEKKDKFLFAGQMEIDDFWTNKSETGEVAYKVILDFAEAQPTAMAADYGYPEEDYGGGYYNEPGY